MKIIIDFVKNQSLGNVYKSEVENNHKMFLKAKALYESNKTIIDGSINETIEDKPVGSTIGIPTLHCQERGMIKSLDLKIERLEEDSCHLALINVKH